MENIKCPPPDLNVGGDFLVTLAMSQARIFAPREFRLETGRLVNLLASRPQGFEKEALLRAFYKEFEFCSPLHRSSLIARLDKVIQRAREKFSPYGIYIQYSKSVRRWRVVIFESSETKFKKTSTAP